MAATPGAQVAQAVTSRLLAQKQQKRAQAQAAAQAEKRAEAEARARAIIERQQAEQANAHQQYQAHQVQALARNYNAARAQAHVQHAQGAGGVPSGGGGGGQMWPSGPGASIQPIQQRLQAGHVTPVTKCEHKECGRSLYSDFDRQLHTMHTTTEKWFCRLCGQKEDTEQDLVMHYIREHLTPTYLKFHENNFKSCVFKLTCPVAGCPQQSEQFPSTKALEKHMGHQHATLLPYETECCDARFATESLRDRHVKIHQKYVDSEGTDTACCHICGTLDLWSQPKDVKIDCLQSHLIRHGLLYRSSCRVCLKQFDSDVDHAQFVAHFVEEHTFRVEYTDTVFCKACSKGGFCNETIKDHARDKHVFNILAKSPMATRGELVVTAGNEYRNFVGLPLPKLPNDDGMPSLASSMDPLPSSRPGPSTSSAPHHRPSPGPSGLGHRPSPGPSGSKGGPSGTPFPRRVPPGVRAPNPTNLRHPQAPPTLQFGGAGSGNEALMSIAQAIGEQRQHRPRPPTTQSGGQQEYMTIDSD